MGDARPEIDRTAVIVLNWNKPEMTVECVESLMTMEGDYDIYVIDNGSNEVARDSLVREMEARGACLLTEDELDEWDPRPKIPRLTLILLKKNYGYAKGNNFGLRLAHRLGYKYSLVSNNDIKIIDRNVLVKLIDAIERDSKYAWAGPRIVGPDGKDQGPYPVVSLLEYALVGGLFYPLFYLYNKKRQSLTRKRFSEVSIPSGAFVLMRTELVARVGYFDENTFLYAEEPILQSKLAAEGCRLAYVPETTVHHAEGVSTFSAFGTLRRFRLLLSSDLYYFRQYRGYSNVACILAAASKWSWFVLYSPLLNAIKALRVYYRIANGRRYTGGSSDRSTS